MASVANRPSCSCYVLAMTRCHGLDCASEDLIEAHIIPKGFGRFISGGGHNIALTPRGAMFAKPRLGEYDRAILCGACDGKLGVLDDYGLEICKDFEHAHRHRRGGILEMPGVNGDKLATFVLSILWRGSISNRPNWKKIALGPNYEKLAQRVVFGAEPLSSFPEFEVIFLRLSSIHMTPDHLRRFYSKPTRAECDLGHCYYFALGGFHILAKFDVKPLPTPLSTLVINGKKVLRSSRIRFEDTPEFASLRDFTVTEIRRREQLGLPHLRSRAR